MTTSMPQAVIFDCDGILADTEPLHLEAFNAVLAPLGITVTPAEYAAHYLGFDDRAAFELALARHDRTRELVNMNDLVAAKATIFGRRLAAAVPIYPGVVAFVRSLAPLPRAVASGARRNEVDAIVQRAGLADCFSAIVTCEDVAVGKPDPEPFLTALASLNRHHGTTISPDRCLVVEDSVVGVTAARRAGMRTLAVTNSFDAAAFAAADLVVSSLDGLRLRDLSPAAHPFISRKR